MDLDREFTCKLVSKLYPTERYQSNALSLASEDQGSWKSVAVSLCRELGAVREAGWVKQAQNM